METVKVDIQKLQLLNDRIAQTIDALNQVRLSVHGIQHTSAPTTGFAQPQGFVQPQGFSPWGQPSYVNPFMQMQNPFVQSPFNGGLQHTSAPFTSQWGMPQTQWNVPSTGWATPFTGGLAHTSYDPYWQVRAQQSLQQTFPFAQYGWTPSTIPGSIPGSIY